MEKVLIGRASKIDAQLMEFVARKQLELRAGLTGNPELGFLVQDKKVYITVTQRGQK